MNSFQRLFKPKKLIIEQKLLTKKKNRFEFKSVMFEPLKVKLFIPKH